MFGEDSPNGGTRVAEITAVGRGPDGATSRQRFRSGRLQFIRDDGSTDRTNATVPSEARAGYMLFADRLIGGQTAWTTDSRRGG
jgi:hypothetical protein